MKKTRERSIINIEDLSKDLSKIILVQSHEIFYLVSTGLIVFKDTKYDKNLPNVGIYRSINTSKMTEIK